MGEDDVICLSSDDEVANDESPPKKAKINCAPLTAKIEPKDCKSGTILCCRKRKSLDDNGKSIGNALKKQRVDDTAVEEIIIESPDTNETTRPGTTIRDQLDTLDKLEYGTITINRVALKKSTESSKPVDPSKSSNAKANIAPVRNDVQNRLTNSNSRESKDKNAIFLKSRTSKGISENPDRLLNPVAKSRVEATSKSCASQMLQINHDLINAKNNTGEMSPNKRRELATSHVEEPKSPSLSSKSGDEKRTSSAEPENIVDAVGDLQVAAANKSDKHHDRKINSREKSGNSLRICSSSNSPEVLILPPTNSPKSPRVVTSKTAVKALFSNSSNNARNSEEKMLPNTDNSTNCSGQSAGNSHLSHGTNSEILNHGFEDIITEPTDSVEAIELAKDSSTPSQTENTTKFEASNTTIRMKNSVSAIQRIKPQRLSETVRKSNQPNCEIAKSSKIVRNSATQNSRGSDSNIPNDHEKSVSSDSENPKGKEEDFSSSNAERKIGNSKTPEKKQSSSVREKSASPESVKKARKKSDNVLNFEPQPGCSKSPDKTMDKKPCLVVVDKKPVSLDTEDTFSMFLSLCLQTDRSLDMEKVVAKLKRYYEELNPAYAASQAFRDTLNEKRDLIMRKGQKAVYHYVQLLKEDMKAKKKIVTPPAKVRGDEGAAEREEEIADAGEEDEDTEEARRVRHKIKRIEKAMKECQRMIKKYEEAEIDFDDDNNSNYIKLDRFKERMVQLYTQMCKYTQEHPDAGRAYLRPKYLRVTQIASVDQAINSFINSKLSINKHKVAKGKSFVDGLIFPDYVDILECVEKVNKEKDMKLSKRAMQNLAEKAFTQLGKHLQEARQNDYWDTFSLNLDNNVDPAMSDSDLQEKLARNKTVAEENEKKVFEEFVRRQEEGKTDDKDDSASAIEDEDDAEDEEQEDEQQDNCEKLNLSVESDEEMSIGEDTDPESAEENDEDFPETVETISEALHAEDKECAVVEEVEHNSKNNNLEPSNSTSDKDSTSPAPSSKNSAGKQEAMTIEVILDDVETEDGENEPQEDEKLQQPLRIRSFAKPPDSWHCSQESNRENNEDNTSEPETLEDTEQEISVVSVLPGREKVVQNLTTNSKTIVGVPLNGRKKNISASPMANSKWSISRSVNAPTTSTNTTNGQHLRYIAIAPGVKRPVQLPSPRVQNNVQISQIIAVSGAPQTLAINTRQVRLGTTTTTSTPVKHTQLQINPRTNLQQPNQVQVLRLSSGKCVSATIGSRPPNTPRFLTVTASSTSIRPVQLAPGALSTFPQIRPAQILPGANIRLTRSQVPSPPRNSNNFSRGVALTSTPIRRLNNHQSNKVKATANLSAAQFSQVPVLRVNNGKYVMSSSSENSRNSRQVEQNTSQQQRKVSNVGGSVKSGNIVASTTLTVLKPRKNDNVPTVQQQKTNVARAPRPGNQNRQTPEDELKRKNELL